MRPASLGLLSEPSYAAGLTLCEKGVVLGNGTVIAGLADLPDERTGIAVEGSEGRILALLSVARDGLAPPRAIRQFTSASQALARGETSLAAIMLCHIGQPRLLHPDLAKALSLAANAIDKGVLPYDLLKGRGLLPADMGYGAWEKFAKYSEDQPREANGRWGSGGTLGGAAHVPKVPPPQPWPPKGEAGGALGTAAKGVNPTNSQTNCVAIAKSVMDRLTGKNRDAVAADSGNISREKAEDELDMEPLTMRGMAETYQRMRDAGDGAIGLVEVLDPPDYNGGHIVVIANDHGQVGIVEGQQGEKPNEFPGVIEEDAAKSRYDRWYGAKTKIKLSITSNNIKRSP